MHGEIRFKIKHLMISNVTGSFNIFSRNAETYYDDFTKCSVRFSADMSLMYTGNEQRDGHLVAANFLMPKKP